MKLWFDSHQDLPDKNDFLTEILSRYIDYSKLIYEKYDYESIYYTAFVYDENGEKINAINLSMTRDKLLDKDWSGIEEGKFYDSFVGECDIYDLSPVYSESIKPDSIRYNSRMDALKAN